MYIRRVVAALACLTILNLPAQNLDSLDRVWKNSSLPDSVRLIAHHIMARAIVDIDPDSALKVLRDEVDFSIQNQLKKYESMAYSTIGLTYYFKGEFNSSIAYYKKSLVIDQELGDRKGMATSLNNIGNNYKLKGEYDNAVLYYQESLAIKEELHDAKGIGTSLNNIGLIYKEDGDLVSALEYFRRSLFIQDSIHNKKGMANATSNIGAVFQLTGNLDSALAYYSRCREIEEAMGDHDALPGTLNNIGGIYRAKGDMKKAEEIFMEGLRLAHESGRKIDIATCYSSLGMLMNELKNYSKGKDYCERSLLISEEIESDELNRDNCHCLSDAYDGLGQEGKALEYYRRYEMYKDSLLNAEHIKAITKTMVKFAMEKKATADSIRTADEKKVALAELKAREAELRQEKYMRIFLVCGLIAVVVISIYTYKRYRQSQEQKHIIEEQKNLVVEKQTMILDSINYAKKIQDALLKQEEEVSIHIPAHFIFFRPRDIVSGDFYWAMEKQGHLYITAADCTGHGVPGAFLTMLGIAFLNEITASDKLLTPARILEEMRDRFITELSQQGKDNSSFDGMDISLARIHLSAREVTWSGANNPLFYFKGGEFGELKANKQPVGFTYEMKAFVDHRLQLGNGDMLYLFSDGYADQFGGEKGKKFRQSNLVDLLKTIHSLPTEEQKTRIITAFDEWKGTYEQVDDVCVLGIRL